MRLLEMVLMTLGGVWQGIRQDLNLLEIALIAGGYWAITKKNWRPRLQWKWMPKRPWLAALGIILGVVVLRLALLPVLPVPVPIVTDEFSHLLLADTLLHGRTANPTHPFWQHFESLHIIQQPHYVSNYFPGQAIPLALGRLLLGSAWAGVLFECALFLVALFWALRGWMPSRWAVFGVLLAALRFGIGSYWVNAYHGGFLPAFGGALIAGAFARLRKQVTFWPSLLFAMGLAILASTRPYEGFAFAVPFIGILLWDARRSAWSLTKIALPTAALVGLTLFALTNYFKSITGSPFVTAYQVSNATYGWPMSFPWTPVKPIQHHHIELKRYYDYEVSEHGKVDGPLDFVEFLSFRLQEYWRFFIGPFLTIPLIMLRHALRRRPMLWIGASGAIAAVLLEGASSPHYIAPATVMLVAIIVECCRYLNASRLKIVPLLPLAMVLMLGLRLGAQSAGLPYTQKLNYQSWCCRVRGNQNKDRIARELMNTPGEHLVLVKSKTDENNLFQWIYNLADIDSQRIVWARDLGVEENARLVRYYANRTVWIVDPNVEPATYTRYQPAAPQALSQLR